MIRQGCPGLTTRQPISLLSFRLDRGGVEKINSRVANWTKVVKRGKINGYPHCVALYVSTYVSTATWFQPESLALAQGLPPYATGRLRDNKRSDCQPQVFRLQQDRAWKMMILISMASCTKLRLAVSERLGVFGIDSKLGH